MFGRNREPRPTDYPCFHGWCKTCDEAGLTVDIVYLPHNVQYAGAERFMGRCVCGKWVAVYPRALPQDNKDIPCH